MTQAPEQPATSAAAPERTAARSGAHGAGLLPAWLTGYRREWLRPDVIAGLIV